MTTSKNESGSSFSTSFIEIKNSAELDILRDCGRIASDVLSKLSSIIEDGLPTIEFDELARKEIKKYGAEPAFVGYRGYPSAVCVSINDELVHGIPSRTRRLRLHDIVSIDLGVRYKGFYGDVAATYPVGTVSPLAERMIKVGYGVFETAILNNPACKKKKEKKEFKVRLGDISSAIEEFLVVNGFSVVRDYVGHGIGRRLHEDPPVPNFGKKGIGPVLEEGMVLAIEPMFCAGPSAELVLDKDGWTARSRDGSLTCHFEHMVVVEANGHFEIITHW